MPSLESLGRLAAVLSLGLVLCFAAVPAQVCRAASPLVLSPPAIRASDGLFCDKVQVTWRAVAGATYYRVRRGEKPVGYEHEWFPADSPLDDATGNPSQIYYYSVLACDDKGCGEPSAPDPGYSDRPPPPDAIAASQGTYSDKVRVEWSPSLGATHYHLYQGVHQITYNFFLLASDLTTTSYDSYSAFPDTTHYYYVVACNSCGCLTSEWATGWRGPSPPTATAPATAMPTSTRKPTLTRVPSSTHTASVIATSVPTATSTTTRTPATWTDLHLPLMLKP